MRSTSAAYGPVDASIIECSSICGRRNIEPSCFAAPQVVPLAKVPYRANQYHRKPNRRPAAAAAGRLPRSKSGSEVTTTSGSKTESNGGGNWHKRKRERNSRRYHSAI